MNKKHKYEPRVQCGTCPIPLSYCPAPKRRIWQEFFNRTASVNNCPLAKLTKKE